MAEPSQVLTIPTDPEVAPVTTSPTSKDPDTLPTTIVASASDDLTKKVDDDPANQLPSTSLTVMVSAALLDVVEETTVASALEVSCNKRAPILNVYCVPAGPAVRTSFGLIV